MTVAELKDICPHIGTDRFILPADSKGNIRFICFLKAQRGHCEDIECVAGNKSDHCPLGEDTKAKMIVASKSLSLNIHP